MKWFKYINKINWNLVVIIALFLVISSIVVFAQELPETPYIISVEFSGVSVPKLDYRFNRNADVWEFRRFEEWIPVTDIGAPINEQHQRLATTLADFDEQGGYLVFSDLSAARLDLGDATVHGLPPPEKKQGTKIVPGEEPSAEIIIDIGDAVIIEEYCTSLRCTQIDQVWINIRGLLSRISLEAKNNVYEPTTKTWSSSIYKTTPPQQSSEQGSENIGTVAVDLNTRPIDQDQRLVWIYDTYEDSINIAASESNLEWSLIVAIIDVESKGDPHAVSCTGAAGLMQFVVQTAQELGLQTTANNPLVHNVECGGTLWETSRLCRTNNKKACDFVNDQRFDPQLNIRTGALYLRQLLDQSNNNLPQALLRYSGNNPNYYNSVIEKKEQIEKLRA